MEGVGSLSAASGGVRNARAVSDGQLCYASPDRPKQWERRLSHGYAFLDPNEAVGVGGK